MKNIILVVALLLQVHGNGSQGLFSKHDNLAIKIDDFGKTRDDESRMINACRFNQVISLSNQEVRAEGIRVSDKVSVSILTADLQDAEIEIDEETIVKACGRFEIMLRKVQVENNRLVDFRNAVKTIGEQERRQPTSSTNKN